MPNAAELQILLWRAWTRCPPCLCQGPGWLSLYDICWTGEVALTGTFKQQWSSRTDFESQEVDAFCSRSFLHKAYAAACYSMGRDNLIDIFGLLIPLAATLNPCYLLMWNAFHFWFTAARVTNTHHCLLHMSFACLDQAGKCGQGRSTWTSTWFASKQLRLLVTSKISRKWTEHVQWMKSLETDTSSVWKSWTSWKACAACSLLPALPSNTLTLHDFVATLCRFTTLWGVAFNRMPRACTKESWWDLAAVPAIPFKGTIGKDLLDIKFTLAKHGVKQIL